MFCYLGYIFSGQLFPSSNYDFSGFNFGYPNDGWYNRILGTLPLNQQCNSIHNEDRLYVALTSTDLSQLAFRNLSHPKPHETFTWTLHILSFLWTSYRRNHEFPEHFDFSSFDASQICNVIRARPTCWEWGVIKVESSLHWLETKLWRWNSRSLNGQLNLTFLCLPFGNLKVLLKASKFFTFFFFLFHVWANDFFLSNKIPICLNPRSVIPSYSIFCNSVNSLKIKFIFISLPSSSISLHSGQGLCATKKKNGN